MPVDLAALYGLPAPGTKTAAQDTASLALRIAMAMLLSERMRSEPSAVAATTAVYDRNRAREARVLSEHAREFEPVRRSADYTRPPILIAPGLAGAIEEMPLGFDQGMVRMASAMGEGLAYKLASGDMKPPQPPPIPKPGNPGKPGLLGRSFGKGKTMGTVLGIGALGAAAWGANKAVNKTNQLMSREAPPADWSMRSMGAPQLAAGVNEYGYAQRGTPFVG